MKTEYRKFPPEDVFISVVGREATEEELWHGAQNGIIFNKHTGNEFLDVFAGMVHHYMEHNPSFYAAKLGVSASELSGCLKVLTGLTGDEWILKYVRLAVCDLLLHTNRNLSDIAKRTGYASVKTFSRSFIKHFRMPPSRWRRAASSAGKK